MAILLKDIALDSAWLLEGCALKLLVWLARKAQKVRSDKVKFSRREAADTLGESEWSVRKALDALKEAGVCRPDSTQPKRAITVKILGSYIEIVSEDRPDSTQAKSKKRTTSPRLRPDSTQIETAATPTKSDGLEVSDCDAPPSSRPDSTQIEEKEIKKESPPTPPIKKITKKKNVLTDGSTDLPDGKPSLNVRAREVFEAIYLELYGAPYYWNGKDAGQMSQLLNKIRFSRENRTTPLPIDDEAMLGALRQFLLAIDKDWICNNFSVSKIASNYNEIISQLRNRRNGKQTNGTDSAAVARRASIISNVASLDEKWRQQNGLGDPDRQ